MTRSGLHGPVTTVVRNEPYQISDQYSYAQAKPLQQQQQYSQAFQTAYSDYQTQTRGSLGQTDQFQRIGQTDQLQSNPLKEMVIIKQEEIVVEEMNKTHPESSKPTLYDQQAQVSATQNISNQNRQNQATGTTANQSNRDFETRGG